MSKQSLRKSKTIKSTLIAPCGMNCRLCRAYVRERKACPGCYGNDDLKSKSTAMCGIKNCEMLKAGKSTYCFECEKFPCPKLNHLDKRYRTKYGMSMIDNLKMIHEVGIMAFIRNEKLRWVCHECGDLMCVQIPTCLTCGYIWH